MSIIAHHSAMMASASTAQVVFDPASKAANITLSNGDKSASPTEDNAGIALSTGAKTTGKYYVEFVLDTRGWTNQACSAGIYVGTPASYTAYLGSDASGFGSWVDSANGVGRSSYTGGVRTNISTTLPVAAGDRMRMAVDISSGRVWLGRWSEAAWMGGGDPASGTLPTYTFAAGASCRIAVNPRGVGARMSLVDPASWANSAPPGFGVWEA